MELISFQGFLILAVLGVLLFGERLPEVAGKFAKQFMELKKSLQGIRDEIQSVAFDAKHAVTHSLDKVDELSREEATAPKFEPPPAEPAVSGLIAEPHGTYGTRPADNS
jgi:Sec-independent protein translocase protein TatA